MLFITASLLTGVAALVKAGPAYVARADTPACHTEWDRNIAYQEQSFVSFEGKNYHNKYFVDKGFDPVGNGEGGWVLDGLCSSAGSGSSGTSPSATTAGDIQVTGTSAAPSKATTAIASSCFTAWDSKAFFYLGGQKISYEGVNYEAKWWAGSWDVPGKGLPWIDRGSCGAFPTSTLSLTSVSSATTEQATSSVEGPVATTTSSTSSTSSTTSTSSTETTATTTTSTSLSTGSTDGIFATSAVTTNASTTSQTSQTTETTSTSSSSSTATTTSTSTSSTSIIVQPTTFTTSSTSSTTKTTSTSTTSLTTATTTTSTTSTTTASAQGSSLPFCYPKYADGATYKKDQTFSVGGQNYVALYETSTNPTAAGWKSLGPCDVSSLTYRPFTTPGVIGYWTQWSGYTRKENTIDKLDLSGFNAINYAFFNVDAKGTLQTFDSYADSLWLNLFNSQRLKYPNLRTIVSIGGWSGSRSFSTIAKDDALIQTFVKNVHTFLDTNGFDGVDLDWEYPGGGGVTCNAVDVNDAANFAKLLAALRTELGPTRTISIAVSSETSHYSVNGVNYIPKYAESVSYIQVMTYDLYGAWSAYSDFNSPLFGPRPQDIKQPDANNAGYSESLSQSVGINSWIKAGAPASKLTVGLAYYGRSWSVQSNLNNGLYQLCTGSVGGKACDGITGDYLDTLWTDPCGLSYHSGVWMYNNLRGQQNGAGQQQNAPLADGPTTASNGWSRQFFDFAQTPTLYTGSYNGKSSFISYDDPVSLQAKAAWAKNAGLGGAFIWELSQDYNNELSNAVRAGWTTGSSGSGGSVDPVPVPKTTSAPVKTSAVPASTDAPAPKPTTAAVQKTTAAVTSTQAVPVVTSKPVTTSAAPPVPGLEGCYTAWSPLQAYAADSIVGYNGFNYKAKWYEGVGKDPVKNDDSGWAVLGACDPSKPAGGNGGSGGSGLPGVPVTLADHRAFAKSLSTDPVLIALKQSVRINKNVDSITPGNPTNPENVKRVERILTADKWKYYFSLADPAYNYVNFLKSVGYFAGFCDTYTDGRDSDKICKKLLSTMFAHFNQETGAHQDGGAVDFFRQGLAYLREDGCTETNTLCQYNNNCADASVVNSVFPCGKNADGSFKKYFGRGAHQLSYNFNYGPFSQLMFDGDGRKLLDNPELVADTWLNLASSVFFFIYPQPPKPSMLWVMDGTWVPNDADLKSGRVGFPSTIQIINGECSGASTSKAAQYRIDSYKAFMGDLGVDYAGEDLKCAGMDRFDSTTTDGNVGIYWVASYDGKPVCQLVKYQTDFNALMDGDGYDQYVKCVERSFNIKLA